MSSPQHQRLRGIRVLKAVSSAVRLQILNLLFDEGELSYTELMNLLKMSPSRDAGRFAYHLKFLLKADLVEVNAESKKYRLTDLGKMVLEVAEEIEKKSLKPQRILVRTSRFTLEEFDVNRIVDSLVKEANMPVEQAKKVAREAEKRLLKAKTRYLTAPLIREVVNGILVEKGLEEYRHKLTRLGLPVHDVSHVLAKGKVDQGASYLCEEFGKNVLGEYTLLNVLPRDVADAHLSGEIHLEEIGYWILKPSETVHDLRFFFKSAEAPSFFHSPKSLEAALNLAFNVLLHSAREVSEAQILEYFNVFLAPFSKGLETVEIKELLRQFILNVNQHINASLNIELTVPDFLADKPVAASSISGVYGDFLDECLLLARLTLEVLAEENTFKPFLNPKVIVKLRPEAFKDGMAANTLLNAHSLAARGSALYFASFLGEDKKHVAFSPSGCRLKPNLEGDWEIDTLRTGTLGVVAVNLPRTTYECEGNRAKFFELLMEKLEMAVRALELKFRMLKQNGKGFLRFLFQRVNGDQYFRLENSAHLVNLTGLEEAVEAFHGRSLCEDESSLRFALEIVRYASEFIHKNERRRDRRVLLSALHSPEASVRLARQDIERFGVAKTRFRGTREKPYYSSFCKISAQNLETSLKTLAAVKELYKQLEGGNLTLIELGEAEHNAETLLALTKRLVESYDVPFFTYNRTLTHCSQCRKTIFGALHKCPSCGSTGTLTVFRRYP
ncbi:MAG: ArsR family transcriptional regulator [Candidatus Bathyarchaeota archaeon]|nr:ArsR family transcriptional regulator [Candidatus Bathyarchaeota archaeon]MDW8040914.1 anaerobic ribonucleoside-triphosphate reductase [Nitrososphaerota archaeon]